MGDLITVGTASAGPVATSAGLSGRTPVESQSIFAAWSDRPAATRGSHPGKSAPRSTDPSVTPPLPAAHCRWCRSPQRTRLHAGTGHQGALMVTARMINRVRYPWLEELSRTSGLAGRCCWPGCRRCHARPPPRKAPPDERRVRRPHRFLVHPSERDHDRRPDRPRPDPLPRPHRPSQIDIVGCRSWSPGTCGRIDITVERRASQGNSSKPATLTAGNCLARAGFGVPPPPTMTVRQAYTRV